MADLISLDRARSQVPGVKDCDDGTLAEMISACSAVVENYCRRRFAQGTYTELLHGTGTQYLHVSNPPISRVVSVRTGLVPALYVQYPDPTNQTQAATVDVTETAVVLNKIYNNTSTTNTLSFSAYPTVGALVTAINALGTWTATVTSQFALWQTSELNHQTGTYGARNLSVPLTVYWYALPFYRCNEALGEVQSYGGFVPGYQNYRVEYVGGFDPIPEEIQQATAELVQLTFASRGANPLMSSETLDKYSYTRVAEASLANLSVSAKLALNQYKLMRVARYT